MDKWEYMIVDSKDIDERREYKDSSEVEQYLNALGAQGWEIINLDLDCYSTFFKFTGVAKRAKRS